MGYWRSVVATAVAVNVAAAAIPAALRELGVFGRASGAVETGLGLVFLLGLVNLFWVLPLFAVAGAVGRAAARRRRATGLLLATVFLAGLPFVLVGPLLVADWPELAGYAFLLYTAGTYCLRRLAAAEAARVRASAP